MSKGSTQRPSSVDAAELNARWAAVFGSKQVASSAPSVPPAQEALTTKDKALKLALDFLESGNFVYPRSLSTAIEEALARPAQEPMAVIGIPITDTGIPVTENKANHGIEGAA